MRFLNLKHIQGVSAVSSNKLLINIASKNINV